MKNCVYIITITILSVQTAGCQGNKLPKTRVTIENGVLEGGIEASGIRSFKGVPFAQPPVGDLRFREPQAVRNWEGVRKAVDFGPRPMQLPFYSDIRSRSKEMSEDCLYLNVWTPAKSSSEHLPVLVYFHGGGFINGDGSESCYDGESMAQRGIVTVTVNYRLGIFGFLVHPYLEVESPHHSSGNYGFLDQHAALVWVQQNIAAFGGDPARVTIAGESAGSFSVSAQMASPLSKRLFAGAIGESGSLLGTGFIAFKDAEQFESRLVEDLGCATLHDLRALSAEKLLAASKLSRFPPVIDGYFLPKSPTDIFSDGSQMPVPLLAGWNSAEKDYLFVLGKDKLTVNNYEDDVRRMFGGDNAKEALRLYKASTPEEVKQVATDLATDRNSGYTTWKWIDLHRKTSGKPVYRYLFAHPRPAMAGTSEDASENTPVNKPIGAAHTWEIEYALGNLLSNKAYAWTADDRRVSETMESYFANFIKSGNPNGQGLASWAAVNAENSPIMLIDVNSHSEPERHFARYKFMDSQKQ